jgi:nicotinic acid mononucleotide adenylyltransferase
MKIIDLIIQTIAFFLLVSSPTKRIVILLCGSFNPVTIAHLRMLELARDYYHLRSIQVLEGFNSIFINKNLF